MGAPQSEIQIHNLPYSLWRWVLQISSVKTLNLVDFSKISGFKQLISRWRDAVDPLCWAFRTRIKSDFDRRLPSTLPRIDTPQGFESNCFSVAFPASDGNTQYTEERRVWVVCDCVCDDHWLVVDSTFSWWSFRPRDMLPSRVVLFLSVFECVRLWFGSTRPIYVLIFIFGFVNCC